MPEDIKKALEGLEGKIEASKEYNPIQDNNKTRAIIALCFVRGFLWTIGLTILFVPFYNIFAVFNGVEPIVLKDILTAISGIISGPLGFVIGHYFKGSEGK